MSEQPVKDIFYIMSISPKYHERIMQAISKGLALVRKQIGISRSITINIFGASEKFKIRKDAMTDARSIGKRTLKIGINEKVIAKQRLLRSLTGTAIHEYVHLLRQAQNTKKVVDVMIEEGIASYIQTKLWFAPEYLDLKTLNEKEVQYCWDTLSAVLYERSTKHMMLWDKTAYHEMFYRLGFGIVRNYIKSNSITNLKKLITTKRERFIKFANKKYSNR